MWGEFGGLLRPEGNVELRMGDIRDAVRCFEGVRLEVVRAICPGVNVGWVERAGAEDLAWVGEGCCCDEEDQ